jgi:hypothetical protein
MKTTGKVTGIVSNLVTVEVNGPVSQNEICYITVGGTKLMAEVIKVNGKNAAVQVFESTRGLKNGDLVEFEEKMLEATLGPGLLSSSYDGLQNDLTTMDGVFLKRGEYTDPLKDVLSLVDPADDELATAEEREFKEAGKLQTILEGKDILARERAIDDLYWEKIDELTLFNYLDFEAILGVVVKMMIIQRWLKLDEQTGREMFRRLVEEVRGTFKGVEYNDK